MNFTQRPFKGKRKRSDEGSVILLVTVSLIVLFGFAALSFDLAHVYYEKRWVQAATDAAAVAGAAQLGDPTVPLVEQAANAISEAGVIANTNGVTGAEIAAAPTNNYAAQIQVGMWVQPAGSAGTFETGVTPYNAVLVPAKRVVPLYFGKVVGLAQMTPTVQSVAAIGAFAVPYGIPSNVVAAVGGTNTLQNWSPGNWGPLDLCGEINGEGAVEAAISGGGCFASDGEVTGTRTGFAGVSEGFQDLYSSGRLVVLPVSDSSPNGNGDVTIVDFIVVKLLDGGSGGGANWTIDVQVVGRGKSGLRQYGLGPARNLVE